MLFSEEDAPLLKKWIINRLADTSDADADVLADYVLALLRHDADTETVRQLCLEEIPDFLSLKEDSAVFVQDVFDAIKYRSYLPGATIPPRKLSIPSQPPTGPSALSYGNLGVGAPLGPLNGARKRSYQDRGEGDFQNGGYQQGGDPNGRQFKQPRRGGPGMGRGNFDNHSNFGRGGFGGNRPPPTNNLAKSAQGYQNMPAMPSPPLGMPAMPGMPPFDPNNPMAAIMAMQQALGLPIPGTPQFPQASSPGPSAQSGPPVRRRKAKCRDYEEKGFCSRGNTCMFEHGEHAIWTPPPLGTDEYNPNTSLMTGIEENSAPLPNPNLRGGTRGRGRGASGRGDFANARRNGRSEFSSDRPNYDKGNTTIVIENIPEEKFTEDEVRGFFSEFGNIVEVDLRPYKRLAIVKFEVWDGANAAYKSPKVIFDNRFVKVYWFVSQDSLPQPPGGKPSDSSHAPAPVKAEPQIDIEEFTRKQQDVQKAHEEKMKKKQEMDTARQALEKRQEELLKNQAEEKRKLLERIAAKSGGKAPSPTDGEQKAGGAEPSQADLLKAQLASLEAEAQSLGIDTSALPDQALGGNAPRGGYRGRGGIRGRGAYIPRGFRGGYRGRGGAPFTGSAGGSVMRLDNRPKSISITGADFTDSEKDESLRQYLLGIGEYTTIEATPAVTTIAFKERFVAEKFMYGTPGCEIPSVGRVEMAWVKNAGPPLASNNAPSSVTKPDTGNVVQKDVTMADEGQETGREANENLDYDVADDDWS